MTEDTQLYADDFVVGDRFGGTPRAVTEESFDAFARTTGDAHPIHYDEAYAKASRFGARVAHGLLVMGMTALGATPLSRRLNDAMIAFVDQGCNFKKPVLIGDTVCSEFQVASVELEPGKGRGRVRFDVRLNNQRDEAVLEGHHTYLLRCRSGA